MKLYFICLLESSKNLPMILGFVVAARLWGVSPLLALVILLVGMLLGISVTRAVEPKLHRQGYEVTPRKFFANLILFTALAVPFVFYFRAENAWLNWKTDLVAGFCAGLLLSLGQSRVWQGDKARFLLHGAAMCISFPVILAGLRGTIQMESWWTAIFWAAVVAAFGSLIIAVVDYQEMYR